MVTWRRQCCSRSASTAMAALTASRDASTRPLGCPARQQISWLLVAAAAAQPNRRIGPTSNTRVFLFQVSSVLWFNWFYPKFIVPLLLILFDTLKIDAFDLIFLRWTMWSRWHLVCLAQMKPWNMYLIFVSHYHWSDKHQVASHYQGLGFVTWKGWNFRHRKLQHRLILFSMLNSLIS